MLIIMLVILSKDKQIKKTIINVLGVIMFNSFNIPIKIGTAPYIICVFLITSTYLWLFKTFLPLPLAFTLIIFSELKKIPKDIMIIPYIKGIKPKNKLYKINPPLKNLHKLLLHYYSIILDTN